MNENVWISLKILLKFVPMVWIHNIPVLVQIMAWRRPGTKPLSEAMMVSLLTYICLTRPQWVNDLRWLLQNLTDVKSTLVQEMAWCHQATSHYWNQCWPRQIFYHMSLLGHNELTHWDWDKIDAILKTPFSNAFSWLKMYEFHLRFHWSLFQRFELTIYQHWFR